jgi:hypothetical protein
MLLMLSLAFAAPPAAIPVQGVLTGADGAPISGTQPVTFELWASEAASSPSWSLSTTIAAVGGQFTAILEGGSPSLSLDAIHAEALWLSLRVGDGPASDRVRLATAPYAASAAYASVADRVGGLLPEDLITWDDVGAGLSVSGGQLVADVDAASLQGDLDARYLQSSDAAGIYLTQLDAALDYLTVGDASSTYLSQADASSTYLTQADASSMYLSQADAAGFLTAETDPQVGVTVAGKWCRSDGSQVLCDLEPLSTSGGSLLPGWPDLIVCNHGAPGEYESWALPYTYTYAGKRYYMTGAFYLVFNADGSWSSYAGFGGATPIPNCIGKSIAQLTASGQTYNTIGGGLPNPPTCTGSGKALQWNGSAWACATTFTVNRSIATSSTEDFLLSSYPGIVAGTSRIEGVLDCSATWSCRKNGLFQFYNAANALVESIPLTEYCDTGSGSDPQVLSRSINRVIPANTARIRMWAAGSGGGSCGVVNVAMKLVP